MSPSAPGNSPSLERIRAQHFELKRTTAQLREIFEGPAPDVPERARLEEKLARFESALNEHFAVEEEGGDFAEVLAAAPRLSERAARLEQAHAAFRSQLVDLRGRITRPNVDWDGLRDAFRHLFAELAAHDTAEDALVSEAFKRDLGG